MKLRVGRIDFTNVWPVFFYFPPASLNGKVSIIKQVPAELNRAMLAGEIDIGAISSFAYGTSCEHYFLLPGLSVSAYGRVGSILLFYKEPLEKALNGRIALTNRSATSVNLLKILVEKYYGGKPSYFPAPPHLEQMMREADAALLIGDDAIKASLSPTPYAVLDLGEIWHQWTGKWMSYAVWAVRKDAVRNERLLSDVIRAFQESKRRGLKHPEEMIAKAWETYGGTPAFWRNYFSNLFYDFGPEQWDGLNHYFRLALEMGLIEKEVKLEFWDENKVVKVNE